MVQGKVFHIPDYSELELRVLARHGDTPYSDVGYVSVRKLCARLLRRGLSGTGRRNTGQPEVQSFRDYGSCTVCSDRLRPQGLNPPEDS